MKINHLRAAAVAASLALVLGAAVSPAAAAPRLVPGAHGLFGSQDATYDGAFRQGLSILALRAAGAPVPTAAVDWLLSQQCADGGFQAFRANTAVACLKPDPVNFRGEDTNSTALAVAALSYTYSTGNPTTTAQRIAARNRALAWLLTRQNLDGGWANFPGGTSDTNSTGVVLAGIRATGLDGGSQHRIHGATAATYLRRVQLPCTSAVINRGALDFQFERPLAPNSSATAQAAWGLTSRAVVAPVPLTVGVPALSCNRGVWPANLTVGVAALTHLNYVLIAGHGAVPGAFGPGPDYTTTVFAVLALVAGGEGGRAVGEAMAALRAHAGTYPLDSSRRYLPGRLALLILAAHATGESPTSFGGVNLVARLLGTLTP